MQFPFFKKLIPKAEYYFGILLKEQEGIGMVLVKQNNGIAVKTYERFAYSNGWENLVEDVDELLFKIEHNSNIQLKKSIFFVYSHLVDEKQKDIKKPYLAKIKELVKSLDLQALGYIECYEAIFNYLTDTEETPLTAILVELDISQLSLFVYKGSKIVYSSKLSRTDNLVDDLISGFEPIKGNFLLPARIVLYDSIDLNEESTKIMTYHWGEEYFVQIPRMKIIKEEEIVQSLASVFEKQLIEKEYTNKSVVENNKERNEKNLMGFVIGEDILENKSYAKEDEEELKQKFDSNSNRVKFSLPKFPLIQKIKEFLLKFGQRKDNGNNNKMFKKISLLIGLIIILTALVLNELFLHKAVITVFVPSQSIEKTILLNGTEEDANDALKINTSTLTTDAEEIKQSTGKRDVGEKARGDVTVHSFDDKEKSFTKGTSFSIGNLSYVLDDDIKVASASIANDGSAKLPGKTSAKLTASSIGPESNIDKNQRFKIDDFSASLYFAINEKAFSGGTKKEVQTVSKKDMEDLQSSLLEKAKKKKQQIQNSANERIINDLTAITLQDLKYSKEVGEEAEKIGLKAKINTKYYYFYENTLLNIINKQFSDELKAGYKLDNDKIEYQINKVTNYKNKIELTVKAKTKASKVFSQKDLIKDIKGRQVAGLTQIIKNKYQLEGFKYNVSNPLPFLKGFLPITQKNITVVTSSL